MKNTIIALLTSALLFFLLHAMGIFEFGSIFDQEYRNWYAEKREKAVNASPTWKLAMPLYEQDIFSQESAKACTLAARLINEKGGILGRPVELLTPSTLQTSPEYNNAVQNFCSDFSIAALIGPFRSGDIPSARAISQYQGLPLVSSVTVASEKLPALEQDNFITFFPPLSNWVEVLLNDMDKRGYREILLVSPESDTYGDIFCTAIERASRSRLGGCRVVRINYQTPLRMQKIISTVRNYTESDGIDAVFFGGKHEDYCEFGHLLENIGITRPVYISDDAYLPGKMKVTGIDALLMPEAVVDDVPEDFMAAWLAETDGRQPSYHTKLSVVTFYAIAKAIESNGGYSPDSLLESLRKQSDARNNQIILHEKNADSSN